MDIFIQKLNFDFLTNQRVMQLIAAIDEYRGKWNVVEKRENRYLKELRKIATIESIGSSTRIEGATMTDEEVKQLLKDIKITKFKTRDEQEVIGYYEVLELIFDNFSEIKLSENYIKQLHQLLLKHSHKDERHRGSYKNLSNKVVATYPSGEQKTIFATTEPALVEGEMFALVEWTNRQWNEKTIHPLIVLAVFVYEFLSIHPFQDGNGRLSRLLTTLFLLQQGYEFMQYISFENHIERNKKAYYDALMTAQRKRITQNDIIDKWLLFFLESLKALTEKLDQKYNVFKQKGGYLNERQKMLKEFITAQKTVKIADLSAAFPDISLNTLKKDVQYLKTEQIISAVGQNKGTVYVNDDGLNDGLNGGLNDENGGINDGLNKKSGGLNDGLNEKSGGINGGINEIVEILLTASGLNAVEIAIRINKSLRTTERCLRLLRKKEIVEYKGSKKTGGYHLTEKVKNELK